MWVKHIIHRGEIMKEIRMEVLNEIEAIEYCRESGLEFIRCYEGRQDNTGKIMMLAIDRNSSSSNKQFIQNMVEEEKLNAIIFATTYTGRMYVADSKLCQSATTFNFSQAKLFKYSAAVEKAKHMANKGSYPWKALKISR